MELYRIICPIEKVLEIIKNKIIWVENGKLMCGRYADTEIELEEDDFENKEEFELLKRWLRCTRK